MTYKFDVMKKWKWK